MFSLSLSLSKTLDILRVKKKRRKGRFKDIATRIVQAYLNLTKLDWSKLAQSIIDPIV